MVKRNLILSYFIYSYFSPPVASFAIPVRITAAEGEPLAICIHMSTTPVTSVLGHDVVMGLSTFNGTGIWYDQCTVLKITH
jgi:hypothetical protein